MMKGPQRQLRPARPVRAQLKSGGPSPSTRRLLLGVAFAAVTTLGWYLERTEPAPASQAGHFTEHSGKVVNVADDDTRHFTEHAGKVVNVSDGDTVRFRTGSDEMRIRLDSIDAPEQDGGAQRPGQPFAQASRRHLEQWLQGRTVTARCFETDQYGRSVCDLIDVNGQSAAQAQVREGYAWAYTAAKGRYLRDASLVALQDQARSAGQGLWQNGRAVAPWVWRYDCWREQKCAQ